MGMIEGRDLNFSDEITLLKFLKDIKKQQVIQLSDINPEPQYDFII